MCFKIAFVFIFSPGNQHMVGSYEKKLRSKLVDFLKIFGLNVIFQKTGFI